MRRIAWLALSLAVIGTSSPAWPWGLDGHRAIGMVADILLAKDPAGAAANQLLGGSSLSEAATWADCAKGFCGALTADERDYVDQIRATPRHLPL